LQTFSAAWKSPGVHILFPMIPSGTERQGVFLAPRALFVAPLQSPVYNFPQRFHSRFIAIRLNCPRLTPFLNAALPSSSLPPHPREMAIDEVRGTGCGLGVSTQDLLHFRQVVLWNPLGIGVRTVDESRPVSRTAPFSVVPRTCPTSFFELPPGVSHSHFR